MKALRIVLSATLLLLVATAVAQNGKKIYADYHGVRYTRAHDGKLGRWEMHGDTRKSATGIESLCYNADLIDSAGRHDLAVVAYPMVGMQSNLDPDNIEYQILAAKTAGIDGFFIEWGFMNHENDLLLKAMQPIAAKYGFEIGVNWCDGWLYYDWITRMHPEINTREAKTEHYARCYQYLVDHVFTGPTAPLVDGRPVFYLFGPGAKPAEYAHALSQVRLPEGMPQPAVLRRWAEWGTLDAGRYSPVRWSDEIASWRSLGMIPTAWLPARVRTRDAAHARWDNYATQDDVLEFMKPFRDSVWMSADPTYNVKSGFVMPGMDNSGCAGWGRGHFYYIGREGGETYKQMWEFNLASRDSLDMIFIASWSDYTEGHEIEPTVENGDRELRTTLHYASQFKQQREDASGLELPARLFDLRKRSALLGQVRRKTAAANVLLDRVAEAIARADYDVAKECLTEAEAAVVVLERTLKSRTIDVSAAELRFSSDALQGVWYVKPELKIYLPLAVIGELIASRTHKGWIEFEYFDDKAARTFIYSRTERKPKDLFATVANFMTSGSGQWRRVRVELHPANVLYTTQEGFTLLFKGNLKLRDVSFHYTLIR